METYANRELFFTLPRSEVDFYTMQNNKNKLSQK